MYIGEYLLWFGITISKKLKKKLKMGYLSDDLTLSQVEKDYTKESMSETPRPIGPYYAYNDRYLEIRGGMFENFRGIVVWIFLLVSLVPYSCISTLIYGITAIIDPESYPFDMGFEFYFVLLCCFIISLILLYLLFRYGRYIYRLEILTIRHIRVRFNRVTRQVYIQRPKYCGGTVVFKWEHIIPANFMGKGDNYMHNTNLVNLITFHPYKTGFPAMQGVGIGKNTYNQQDYLDEWEFIRRYMEDGPAGLPRPWISTLLPFPFHGLEGHVKPMIRFAKENPHLLFRIMMIPVFLILLPFYTVGYFVSECLCWQPRWPKVIRQAGKPGKPIPAETKLEDYPKAVQENILANRLEWSVLDDKTGKYIDYGNS